MSDYMERFRRRMIAGGDDIGDAYANNTVAFMEKTFHASPTFRVMEVKGEEYADVDTIDGRVIEVERLGSLREVLFRPLSEGVNVGAYLVFDKDTWLVFDRFGQNKVLVQRCNRTIRWYDKDGFLNEVDCVASATDLGSKSKQSKDEIEWNKYDVRLPLGQLFVFAEWNESTKYIGLNHRFVFGSKVYEVTGVDDTTTVNRNGHGVVQFTIKITTIREEDDFENQIAQNIYDNTSDVKPAEGEGGSGGIIW